MNRRMALIAAISVSVFAAAPFIGNFELSFDDIIHFTGASSEIFWRIRFPRVLMSFMSGAVLSMCGMIFQAIFRNPLATPYTLGIASGASLGAAFYFLLATGIAIPAFLGAPLFSFAGAVISMAIVYGLGGSFGGGRSILLVGVALNFSFSSIIMFIQYISGFVSSQRIIRFMIGGLDTSSLSSVFFALPFMIMGFAVTMICRRELDLITTGEDVAASRGVNVAGVKTLFYLVTSLMLASIISVTGPIGFVGMMAPHICRIIIGQGHQRLTPASFLFGGAFLTACDTIARTVIFPTEIPVGVITSMLGGPFFIFLLKSAGKKTA